MNTETKYAGAMITETAAGWVAGDEMEFDSLDAAQSHGEERLRNEEESARPAKLTWRVRELEPSLPNVKVHTPLPASASDETEVKP